MPTFQVGLVGYGMAGQVFHAPILNAVEGLHLKSVVERRSEHSKERYPWVSVVKSVEALLEDADIDLVVVATRNDSHFDIAQQALRAGKHVVVDKPFTITSQEAHTLEELARQKNRVASVFQNRRWDGGFKTVRHLVEQQMLGDLVDYECHFDRFRNFAKPNAWREEEVPGAGILYDLGAHVIDQAHVLFGWPQTITATIRNQRQVSKVDDAFEILLDYGRLKVTLKAGMLIRELGPHFQLHGTEGSFVKYGLDPQEAALKAGNTPQDGTWGTEPESDWGLLNTQIHGFHFRGKVETFAGDYREYYQNIRDAMQDPTRLIVTPRDGFKTIRLIELARQSHTERRTLSCGSLD